MKSYSGPNFRVASRLFIARLLVRSCSERYWNCLRGPDRSFSLLTIFRRHREAVPVRRRAVRQTCEILGNSLEGRVSVILGRSPGGSDSVLGFWRIFMEIVGLRPASGGEP